MGRFCRQPDIVKWVTIKNVDLLAENLVNQIYEQDNKSRENMNAKNDGEMQW